MDYVKHLIIVFLNSRYKYNVYQVFRLWENKNTVKAQHKSDYITSIILRILIGIQMNIGSNKPGLCYPFNVQVNMSYKLFSHAQIFIDITGLSIEYCRRKCRIYKKKIIRGKNESLRVFHECAENLTKDIFLN